jgi:hypothetical protein
MRVVLSYVGNDTDFFAGWLIPSRSASSSMVEGSSFVRTDRFSTYLNKSVSLTYYEDDSGISGMWYHGAGSRLGTSVESFTIDVSKMTDVQQAFYVRIPQTKTTDPGIWDYRASAKLRVDIYMPEDSANEFDQSIRPAQTFYLSSGVVGANPSAAFWHVFNVRKPLRGGGGGREGADFAAQIIPINKTITDFRSF